MADILLVIIAIVWGAVCTVGLNVNGTGQQVVHTDFRSL